MPNYDFKCAKCGEIFEEMVPMKKSKYSRDKKTRGLSELHLFPKKLSNKDLTEEKRLEDANVTPDCPKCESNKDVVQVISGAALRGVN